MPDFVRLEQVVHAAPRDAVFLVPRDLLLAFFQRYTDMELQLTEFILSAKERAERA